MLHQYAALLDRLLPSTHLSICNTLLPFTDSTPLRIHSVRPVPSTTTSYSGAISSMMAVSLDLGFRCVLMSSRCRPDDNRRDSVYTRRSTCTRVGFGGLELQRKLQSQGPDPTDFGDGRGASSTLLRRRRYAQRQFSNHSYKRSGQRA